MIEVEPGPIPEQWKRLDISTPFLRSAVESQNPLRVELGLDLGPGASISHLGPLVGMHSDLDSTARRESHAGLGHGGL